MSKVDPPAAVPGAAIEVKGGGLTGRGTIVTVGGRRAQVVAARSRLLRVVVPRVRAGRHQLVVRRGRLRGSRRLRVLRAFNGEIGVTPDARRRSAATIGPAGGEVEATGADGTRYTLSVPAGSLTSEQQITVTPARRFRGLPFTGSLARGVVLEPSGLRFAAPATLTISSPRPLRGATVGFSDSDQSGSRSRAPEARGVRSP